MPSRKACPNDYDENAVRVLNKVIAMENLDVRMAANTNGEREDMANKMREILAKIGYSEAAIQGIA